MSNTPFYVSIYMRPYLVDYLIHYYGGHPIKADEKSRLLPLLAEHITHPPVKYKPLHPGPNVITFELPYNKVFDIRSLNYISPERFSKIQSYFYHMFCWHFFCHMDENCLVNKIPFKTAIIHFMETNQISYDRFQYDSLKRIYFRHRKKYMKINK